MKRYKVTIVDNSLIDILALKNTIDKHCKSYIDVNHFLTIEEAAINIKKNRPDIIFINIDFKNRIMFNFIKLFKLNGVKVILTVSENDVFNLMDNPNSLEYLVKPYIINDVLTTINQTIKTFVKVKISNARTVKDLNMLTISSSDKVDFIEMNDIIFCMADGKYTSFYLADGKKIISSKNLGEYQKVLNELFFYRVHHGYIINVKYLSSIIKKDGTYCKLINDINIPIAKRKQGDFNKFMKIRN